MTVVCPRCGEERARLQAAARGYAEAAQRWLDYPFVPERGLALLGAHGLASEAAAA